MSHGSGGDGGVKAEPNLTPMLDMVLQLVMFFMLVCNFTMEQVNKDIDLPKAQSARATDKREVDVRYLNVNSEGKVLVLGRREPLDGPLQVEEYLRDEVKLIKRSNEAMGDTSTDLKTVIIIRADRRVDYKPVYEVLQIAKKVGFRKLQLNAMTQGK